MSETATADLSRFRVAGFDDEGMGYTQPVEVSCGQCDEAQAFTWRDDGGADYTESLPALVAWAAGHQCKEAPVASSVKTESEGEGRP